MSTTGRARLPYINKDYESIRRELIARIPTMTSRWTDFNASDLGIVLLELFAGVGDMLAYYLDAQAAECYLATARRRESIINLCALVNYRLHGPVASTTSMRFTLAEAQAVDVVILAGTVCRAPGASEPIPFVTVEELTISAGQTTGDVDVRQGYWKAETATGTGQAFQLVTLATPAAAHGTVAVQVNGVDWMAVEHFAESDADDLHYRVDIDALDVASVVFGDGLAGAKPGSGLEIACTYLVTLGAAGNLAPGRITELPDPILVGGQPIDVSVTNITAATGGEDAESHEDARRLAPATMQSTWKAVTKADYQTLCERFPGVGKAAVLDLNDEAGLRIYSVRVVIAPAGGGMPSAQLKADVLADLNARRLVTVEVAIDDPTYRSVPVTATLYIYPGETPSVVQERAEDALAEYFAFDTQSFGGAVYTSDLVALLDGIEGVSHVALQAPSTNLTMAPRELAALGTVTLTIETVGS
jgi:hypothetical protein